MDLYKIVGLAIIAFGLFKWVSDNGFNPLSFFNKVKDAVDDVIPTGLQKSKLQCFRDFFQQLDPKKDKEKREMLLNEFSEDILKDFLNEK